MREGVRTATSMRSLATVSRLRITFFSILTSWASFLARSGPKAPAAFLRKAWPGVADRLLALGSLSRPKMVWIRRIAQRNQAQAQMPKGIDIFGGNGSLLTKASTTEDAARLGGRRRRWGVLSRIVSITILFTHLVATTAATFSLPYLNLRGSGRPRCAHGISSMHDGETDYRDVIELGGEQQQQQEQCQSTPRSKAKLC